MVKISVLIFAFVAFVVVEGKHFDKCGMVRELRKQGFPEHDLRNWICLIQAESSFYTNKTNKNKNGSIDYGLFQINNRYWCSSSSTPGKDCHVKCSDLLLDDITKASACAKIVFKRQGFRAWYGWRNHCQGSLPDISNC